MKDRSLSELRRAYQAGEVTYQELLELMKTDSRKGLLQLIESIHRQRQAKKQLLADYHKMNALEQSLREAGFHAIAGLDEVGRGPLAGPVVTAAVILDPNKPIYGLKDSKTLSAKRRLELAGEIRDKAIAYSLHANPPEVIDRINILQATKQSMLAAIEQLRPAPDYLLIDALELNSRLPQTAVIKGDNHCLCIAAASIIAKVERDQMMQHYHQQYPEYGFDQHVGYGTSQHIAALKQYGPTPIHRRSFITNFL